MKEALNLLQPIHGIVHVGAHIGQEAELYHSLGVKSVIWIEPDKTTFQKLQENISKYPGQIAINALVGEHCGDEVDFRVASNDGVSSSCLVPHKHLDHHPDIQFANPVKMQTKSLQCILSNIREVMDKLEYWCLVLDVQGYEDRVIRGTRNYIERFQSAIIEVNSENMFFDCPWVENIDNYMAYNGLYPVHNEPHTGPVWDRAYKR